MIKIGVRPTQSEMEMKQMYSPNRELAMNPNFNLLNENKDLGISTKFLVSTESHKDEQSMLRLLNGEISSNERSVNLSGNFKKVKGGETKVKKKKKRKGKDNEKKRNVKKKKAK
jgi:hypothetical protein